MSLSRYGMILDVPPGVYVGRDGVAAREVSLALEGEFGVFQAGAQLAR